MSDRLRASRVRPLPPACLQLSPRPVCRRPSNHIASPVLQLDVLRAKRNVLSRTRSEEVIFGTVRACAQPQARCGILCTATLLLDLNPKAALFAAPRCSLHIPRCA